MEEEVRKSKTTLELERQEEIIDEIRIRFRSLLLEGGRITASGIILQENEETDEEVQTIKPLSNENLSFWYGSDGTHFLVGDKEFVPNEGFSNLARKTLIDTGLILLPDGKINHRFNMRKFTRRRLEEIAIADGRGKIEKPAQITPEKVRSAI